MKISKYSKIKDNQIKASSIVGGGSSSSTTIEGGSSVSLDRTIWGKEDVGEDIDGHMTVNGDITIKAINYDWEDGDDDSDGDDVEYDEGGGNLNVELKTTTKDLDVENDTYVKNHLYINYNKNHSHSENKKCLGDILNSIETNVETNKTNIASNLSEINSLKSRVKINEDDISSLKSRLSDAETAIENNADEITKLKQKSETSETTDTEIKEEIEAIKEQMADGSAIDNLLKQIKTLKYGDIYNPVILYSGVLSKLSTSDIYVNNGCIKDCLSFSITDITEGVMTIVITPRFDLGKDIYCYVRSVDATQEKSNDTEGRNNYYKERSNGAHWFESWFEIAKNKTTIKLREFHQGNGDNDTWYSSSWTESGGIRAVNLTINGYITFLN